MFKQAYTYVPIQLAQYAHEHKMHKALGLYLLLRASCDGHTVLNAANKAAFKGLLGIKDNRSINKHLQKLLKENWVGYDEQQEVYYIRGIKELRSRFGFHDYRAVVFYISKDAPFIKEFIQGAILNNVVKIKNKARKAKIKKLAGSSALLKESAIQELAADGKITEYIGLSLSVIGKILGVSQSQADRIKNRLQRLGYISTKPRFIEIQVSESPDFSHVIKYLPSNRRYSIKRKRKSKGKKIMYELRERTYDEFFPAMDFKNQKSIVRRIRNFGEYGARSGKKASPITPL